MEPNLNIHYFFEEYEQAVIAWQLLENNEEIDLEIRQNIAAPRQTHGGWIFDKETIWQ
jgi:hypothetical protein